jgi:hypothetical protein
MFSCVFFSIFAAPRLSSPTDTAAPSCVFGWNEASVSWSPVTTTSRFSNTGCLSRV